MSKHFMILNSYLGFVFRHTLEKTSMSKDGCLAEIGGGGGGESRHLQIPPAWPNLFHDYVNLGLRLLLNFKKKHKTRKLDSELTSPSHL